MDRHGKVGISEKYAKSVDKETFVNAHKHIYPHLDLGAEYDKIVGPATPIKEPAKKELPKKTAKK